MYRFSGSSLGRIHAETSELVQILVESGADVNAIDDELDITSLHYAAQFNTVPEVVERLIDLGANVQAKDKFGRTPLLYAVANNPIKTVTKTLIEADPEADYLKYSDSVALGLTLGLNSEPEIAQLLIAAGYNEEPEIISALIDVGADSTCTNEQGMNAIHIAVAHNSNSQVLEALIEEGIDVNTTNQ
ncbi:MAG: ankyrin repeat domain-containing protein [Bacteroidetes bacterium]|nr:ankyrin repeat domain-containing protein [Bacteroidota bacterium]MCY4205457.1 ankyrin repeat domain-containing protein [Bacteroidota bacterium]